MRWVIKDPVLISRQFQRHLLAATPLWRGDYMREAMRDIRRSDIGDYLAICLFKDANLIGWSMLDFSNSAEKSVWTYIYVRTRYRRKGFGKKILNRAKKLIEKMGKKIRVCPHDRRSKNFFKKVGIRKCEVVYGYSL